MNVPIEYISEAESVDLFSIIFLTTNIMRRRVEMGNSGRQPAGNKDRLEVLRGIGDKGTDDVVTIARELINDSDVFTNIAGGSDIKVLVSDIALDIAELDRSNRGQDALNIVEKTRDLARLAGY